MAEEADNTATAVLKRASPFWYWVRANFSLPALFTLLGVVGAAGSYIASLKTRVVVLEHEVVHITQIVPDSATIVALKTRVDDHEGRIKRIEDDWDYARTVPAPQLLQRRKGERR